MQNSQLPQILLPRLFLWLHLHFWLRLLVVRNYLYVLYRILDLRLIKLILCHYDWKQTFDSEVFS